MNDLISDLKGILLKMNTRQADLALARLEMPIEEYHELAAQIGWCLHCNDPEIFAEMLPNLWNIKVFHADEAWSYLDAWETGAPDLIRHHDDRMALRAMPKELMPHAGAYYSMWRYAEMEKFTEEEWIRNGATMAPKWPTIEAYCLKKLKGFLKANGLPYEGSAIHHRKHAL